MLKLIVLPFHHYQVILVLPDNPAKVELLVTICGFDFCVTQHIYIYIFVYVLEYLCVCEHQ